PRANTFHARVSPAPARHSDALRVMPGVGFTSRPLTSGQAFVGMRRLTPRDPAILPQFQGLVSSLGLSYRLLTATTIRVTFNRDLQYSYEVLQPYFLDNSLAVSVRRALGQDFDVIVDGQRH